MLAVQLNDAAGRTAYLAGFHAAQALISEKTGKSVKTHKGVHAKFHELVRGDPRLDPELRAFLSRAYRAKAAVDYDTGPEAVISNERAAGAIQVATRFVAYIERTLDEPREQ